MHDNWLVSYQTATWYLEFEMSENQVMNISLPLEEDVDSGSCFYG